jgi:hypothetical protein
VLLVGAPGGGKALLARLLPSAREQTCVGVWRLSAVRAARDPGKTKPATAVAWVTGARKTRVKAIRGSAAGAARLHA